MAAPTSIGKEFDRQRRFVRCFRQAGAIDPEHAVALNAIRERNALTIGERNTATFRKMVKSGVFLSVQDGRFFIDEKAAAKFMRRAWWRYWIQLGILLLILIVLLGPKVWRIYHQKR